MNERWQLRVFDNERVYVAELTGPAEIGRQQNRDEAQPAHKKVNDAWRVVIAPLDEVTISRRHLEVMPMADGRFLLANKSANQVVGLPDGQELQPGASCQMSVPVMIRLGSKTLRLQVPEEEPPPESLPMATLAPGSSSLISSLVQATIGKSGGPAMEAGQLTAWIQAFLGLLQSAAGSEDFYVQATRALVDLVKLDSGRVLFRVGQSWQEKTVQALARSGGAFLSGPTVLPHGFGEASGAGPGAAFDPTMDRRPFPDGQPYDPGEPPPRALGRVGM